MSGPMPATFVSTDSPSLQAFLASVRASPAFKALAGAKADVLQ
jgi:hypothetical protein